jgi:hypothetical protein
MGFGAKPRGVGLGPCPRLFDQFGEATHMPSIDPREVRAPRSAAMAPGVVLVEDLGCLGLAAG